MFDIFFDLCIVITVILYGFAAILLSREMKNRNFQVLPLGGTYNVILYYREIKRHNKKLSKRFWFYIFSSINLIIFIIIFIGIAIGGCLKIVITCK